MTSLDAQGAPLSLGLFIKAYTAALKLAPGRFLTLRLTPDNWTFIQGQSDPLTHVIRHGEINGPLGKKQVRVACVPAPDGLGDGVAVVQDENADPTKLVFEIHGNLEFEVVNMADASPHYA